MKKIIMILLVVFGLGVGSRAQAQMLNLNYQMSLPLGDQHDFISKMSFRGFSMDYHYFLSERLAVGASLGWNTLYKHLDYATGHFTMNGEERDHLRGPVQIPERCTPDGQCPLFFYGWRCCPATICRHRHRNQLG